jgi:2-hydroxycyclohexanecarboxyl-CoA dehydrogenase
MSQPARVAVVTGGASGIGLGVAEQLLADGRKVAIWDLKGAEEAATKLQGSGAVVGAQVDVADRASVDAAAEQARAELGPIEILVTSAGVEAFEPLLDITAESWDRIIAVNLTGTFHCVQAVVPDMLAAGWMTRSLAVELARSGITANAVSPTVVDTPMAQEATARGDFPGVDVIAPMIPAGRAGTPADIAAACSYLTSDAAGYTTGQVLAVSGGMYI